MKKFEAIIFCELRNAIADVVNHIFKVRMQEVWGEGTTSCASDSKEFGAWGSEPHDGMAHPYRGRGVMIYWLEVYSKLAITEAQNEYNEVINKFPI
ncbi:Tn3 family transposase [Paenibacillus sp. FSL H3-0333]|uniref:Tn3 family transposase n=1 Tax=Paenibacillus sp. FSL H3-0333 TaxID=2921373 RepID=UPI004046A095